MHKIENSGAFEPLNNNFLIDIIGLKELQEIQDAFSTTFNVSSIITDLQGNPITRPSKDVNISHENIAMEVYFDPPEHPTNCIIIDEDEKGNPKLTPKFNSNFLDTVTPIYIEKQHIANLIVNQNDLNNEYSEDVEDFDSESGTGAIMNALKQIPRIPARQFTYVLEFAKMLSQKMSGLAYQNYKLKREISKRKSAEEELQKQQQQLMQADKLAALGMMVSSIAHEINNPNNSIMLNAHFLISVWESIEPLLMEKAQKEKEFNIAGLPFNEAMKDIKTITDDVLHCSERISKIVGELKNYIRPGPDDSRQEISINEVIQSSINLMRHCIYSATDNLNLELAEDIPSFQGSFQEFEQIVVNLLQNACQALDSRKKSISIHTKYRLMGSQVIMEIQDTGKGIPKNDLKNIFDPFYTTKREQGGTGLGLSIIQKIIKRYNAKIEFKSKVNKGTTVTLKIPVKQEHNSSL